MIKKDIPGHLISSQSFVSRDSPEQVEPPPDGKGELHFRFRVCEPFPQVAVQSP